MLESPYSLLTHQAGAVSWTNRRRWTRKSSASCAFFPVPTSTPHRCVPWCSREMGNSWNCYGIKSGFRWGPGSACDSAPSPLTRGTFGAIEPRVLEGWQGCTQDTRTDGHVGRPLERQLPVAEDHGRRGAPPGMAHEVEQLDVKFYLEVFQPKRPHTHTTSKKKARV